jgi:hypothetical protein
VALALRVLGATGWHVTEVVRFSKHGVIEDLPPDHVRKNGAAKVLVCWHKGGFAHPSPVTEKVAQAAAKLQRLGGISRDPSSSGRGRRSRRRASRRSSQGDTGTARRRTRSPSV